VISESTFTAQGHGVHSAYLDTIQAISQMDDVEMVSGMRSLGTSVILHLHTIGPTALARMLIHRGHKIVTAHITPASLVGSIICVRPLLGLIGRYMRFVYNRADSVIAVSEATATELAELKVRRPITVSHNAIDSQPILDLLRRRVELRGVLGWHGDVVVLAVGQLQPRKGVEEFLECASALPRIRFVWVGGAQFGSLSAGRRGLRHICAMAPDNVRFVGILPRPDVFRYYVAADAFFLPSRQETFGLAALEAATASLPLLLRDLGCYREWLGRAYLSGTTIDEYVSLLRQLEDPGIRRALGAQAALAASEHGRSALITGLRDAYDAAVR
jgi:1,2-diacylglycerol-3-alpha-glucose alpha-1,2-galactosyltransferase